MAMPYLQCDVWDTTADEDKSYKVLLYDAMWYTPFKGELFKMLGRVRLCSSKRGVYVQSALYCLDAGSVDLMLAEVVAVRWRGVRVHF